jgi:hypothetical protein
VIEWPSAEKQRLEALGTSEWLGWLFGKKTISLAEAVLVFCSLKDDFEQWQNEASLV